MKNIETDSKLVNGVKIEQRIDDGFINATAICKAYSRKFDSWFRTLDTLELFIALGKRNKLNFNPSDLRDSDIRSFSASKLSKILPDLIIVKRGSPENGGGTWLHPYLAYQLAQWCDKNFALAVSEWIDLWRLKKQNSDWIEKGMDRIEGRTELKDSARVKLCDQIKKYLQEIGKYDNNPKTRFYFSNVHDKINKAVTTEKAKQMRKRISIFIGKEIKDEELIRNYFPARQLRIYSSVCQLAANYIRIDGLKPNDAVDKAIKYGLPEEYEAKPIDFENNIKNLQKLILAHQKMINEQSNLLA